MGLSVLASFMESGLSGCFRCGSRARGAVRGAAAGGPGPRLGVLVLHECGPPVRRSSTSEGSWMGEVVLDVSALSAGAAAVVRELLAEVNAGRPVEARELTEDDVRRWLPGLVQLVSQPGVPSEVRNVVRQLRGHLSEVV